MKKVLFTLCALLFALCAVLPGADAKVWEASLKPYAIGGGTGVTTSGTSPFALESGSDTVLDLSRLEDKNLLSLQIKAITVINGYLTGQTPAYTAETIGVTLYWRESMTRDGLTSAELHPILINKLVGSGDTPYFLPFRITSANYGQLLFNSGNTAWGVVQVQVKASVADSGVAIQPVLISTHASAFSTSGTSKFYSGATGIPVAQGCRYVEVQPVGDAVHFTVDGTTTPTTSHTKIANEAVWTLTREEWAKFWMAPAGNAVGTLNVKQWTAKP